MDTVSVLDAQGIQKLVAARIRGRRLELGLTQQEAADRLGMDRTAYNAIENSRRSIGPAVALRLANLYGGAADDYLSKVWSNATALAIDVLTRLRGGEPVNPQLVAELVRELNRTAVAALALAAELRDAVQSAQSNS